MKFIIALRAGEGRGALAGRLRSMNIEHPTLFVAVVVHGGWLMLTYWHGVLAWPVLALFDGVIVSWHGSLQHETIHGHPTGIRCIDAFVGSAPLSLWLPYSIYRRSHLAHHAAPSITDPFGDPESNYVASEGSVSFLLAKLEATLIGRLVLGPPIRLTRFIAGELRRVRRRPAEATADWALHALAVVPVLWWLERVGLSLGAYILLFV